MIPGAFESMTGEQPTTRDYEGTESPRCGPGIFVCKKLVTSVESDKSPHHRCHKLKAQSTSRRPPGNNDDLIFHAPASPCTIIDDKKQLLTKSTGVGSVALRGGIQEGWLPPCQRPNPCSRCLVGARATSSPRTSLLLTSAARIHGRNHVIVSGLTALSATGCCRHGTHDAPPFCCGPSQAPRWSKRP